MQPKKPYTNHSQLTMNLKSMKFRGEKRVAWKKLFILTFLLFLFWGKKGHNKSLPMVSDLASMGQDIKRCSLRSAGSLPEGIAHPTTYITTNVPSSNERGADDDSLYGTPKEEIPPFMVSITILQNHSSEINKPVKT